MFAKRGVPNGTRKRQNTGATAPTEGATTDGAEGDPAGDSGAPKEGSSESEGEHAKIFQKKWVPLRQQRCKHVILGRSSEGRERKRKATEDLMQKSNPKLTLHDDQRATASFEVDTEKSHDHRAIIERSLEIREKIEKGELKEGIYRGLEVYNHHIKPKEGALSRAKSSGLYGPVRGTSNVRMTMYVDLNPEICKDYKETGYCGYGDCCKFLHDRTDYKGGWQIEKEWQEMQKKKQEKMSRLAEGLEDMLSSSSETDSEEEDDLDDGDGLPFACLACRRPWKAEMKPVVTNCLHYFCEKCAREGYSKSVKCVQCGADTSGIFNVAEKIIEKLRKLENDSRGKHDMGDKEAVDAVENGDTNASDGDACSPVADDKEVSDSSDEDGSRSEDGVV